MEPLVSAIMPARGRPALAAAALACWRRQTWPNSELVVVDDAECPAFPDGIHEPRVNYHRIPGRLTIGAKRNLCCERAAGEFIVQMDSDDWNAQERIADQMALIQRAAVPMVGYHSLLWTDGSQWWRYVNRDWFGGTGLLYRRDWWVTHPHPDGPKHRVDAADKPFVDAAIAAFAFASMPARDMLVARIHGDNTSPKGTTGPDWRRICDSVECRRLASLLNG